MNSSDTLLAFLDYNWAVVLMHVLSQAAQAHYVCVRASEVIWSECT